MSKRLALITQIQATTERFVADADSQNISESPIDGARIRFLLIIFSLLMTEHVV